MKLVMSIVHNDDASRLVDALTGANYRATQKEYDELRNEAIARYKTAQTEEKKKRKDAHWEATTVFEATKDGPQLELKETEAQLSAVRAELEALQQDAVRLLTRRRQWREHALPQPNVTQIQPGPSGSTEPPLSRTADLLARAGLEGPARAERDRASAAR